MAVDFQTVLSSPVDAYAEGLKFFQGKGMLNDALRRIASDLERNGISYVVIGAVALNQHGYRQFTEDIGLLLTKQEIKLKNLGKDFAEKLDDFVRGKYLELYKAVQPSKKRRL